MLCEGKKTELQNHKQLTMLNRIKTAWIKYIKPCFCKADVTCRFSVGQRGEDGFAPLLKDGQETNVRLMIWDREEVEELQRIAAELQNGR